MPDAQPLLTTGLDIALKKALRKSCKVIPQPSEVMLGIAMQTLRQIASTPRNRGARISANATLKFIETQMSNVKLRRA